MISYINGTIKQVNETSFIIENNNIGYFCTSTKQTINNIELNKKYIIYTKLVLREPVIDLYGFYDQNELNCFNTLIKISGVGMRVALNILSFKKYNKIYKAILNEDVDFFVSISGVGIKMAKRIINELKDKIVLQKIDNKNDNNIENDILNVLLNLGYKRQDIIHGIKNIKNINELSDENIIKQMLLILK